MTPLSKISWGPVDATSRDDLFSAKWVEPNEIRRCLHDSMWIISGEKGSGKSAIKRALTEIYDDKYDVIASVDFDHMTFDPLYKELVSFSATTNLSKLGTLSHFWQYTIIIQLLITCAEKYPDVYQPLLDEIPGTRKHEKINQNLLGLIQEAWNMIDEFTGTKVSRRKKGANLVASSGLTAEIVHSLSTFPIDEKFLKYKREFFEILRQRKQNILIVLDGFDKVQLDGSSTESIQLIFASLVQSLLDLKKDGDIPDTLHIKALIPHDRYITLQLRDSDKVDVLHSSIQWTRDALQDFLKKRIDLSLKGTFQNFTASWKDVFPEFVTNTHYNVKEDSFDYILRHTMYRPRHFQIHLTHLASQHPDVIIDPSMISKCIAKSNEDIARHYINEYKMEHKNLNEFVNLFHNKSTVMPYSQFQDIVRAALKRFEQNSGSDALFRKIDTLYSMGFFGIVESGKTVSDDVAYYPWVKDGSRIFIDFFYKNPNTSISVRLNEDDLIAIHPIFTDYAGLKPHPDYIVG